MCKIYYTNTIEGNAVNHTDYVDYQETAQKKTAIVGFAPEYKDVVDYILGITHRIWEERSIGVIYDTYHNECRVHTCSSLAHGIKGVILHTMEDQHAYPNRRLAPQEVIWADDGDGVYFSSHRLLSTGTHLGENAWSKPTGKEVANLAIADCYMKDNRIFEEWLVRDTLAQLRCLGVDAVELAKKLAAASPAADSLATKGGIRESMEGQYYPNKYVALDDSLGELMKEMHYQIFAYKYLNRVTDFFTADAVFYTVGGECLKGHDAIQGALMGLLSCFASAAFDIHRITVNQNEDGTANIAVRWILQGQHEGWGMFGAPTNKSVEIMAVSHYHWDGSKIDEAWMIYDVLDVLKQIYAGYQPQIEN